jgi:hypothetical protein
MAITDIYVKQVVKEFQNYTVETNCNLRKERTLKLEHFSHLLSSREKKKEIQQNFPFIQAECNTSCVENSKAADMAATELDWLIVELAGSKFRYRSINTSSPLGWKFEHVQRN